MKRPTITDNDAETITVCVDGEDKMVWCYANDEDRREKMRHAHYWCDGYMAGQGAPLRQVGEPAE